MKMEADTRSELLFDEEEAMPGSRQWLIHCVLFDFITWTLFLQVNKFAPKRFHSGSAASEDARFEAPRLIRQHFNQTKAYSISCSVITCHYANKGAGVYGLAITVRVFDPSLWWREWRLKKNVASLLSQLEQWSDWINTFSPGSKANTIKRKGCGAWKTHVLLVADTLTSC